MQHPQGQMETTLDLGLVGNGGFAALIDQRARVVWGCVPAFDGDPVFCSLLSPQLSGGDYAIELEQFSHAEQAYVANTAILRTVLHDTSGAAVEVIDTVPRWHLYDRFHRPRMLTRRITPLYGAPRIRLLLRPLCDYAGSQPAITAANSHLRIDVPGHPLRHTSDVPARLIRDGLPFVLDRPVHCVLGPDEPLGNGLAEYVLDAEQRTEHYWREWVRYLSIPLEWQEAVIRSAITLKLCQYEDTGAIVAAMTTSIPEAPDSGRNWDYRYCWLRDAAFVVRALNRLGATRSMEDYIRYIFNLAVGEDGALQPLYGIDYQSELTEEEVPALAGYRGMGPVRRGNLAWLQKQHDVYGSVILASAQLFFDQRLQTPAGRDMFERLEPLGERAYALYNVPDAGLWEFRGREEVHTYSCAMCWAACDRLAKIALHLQLEEAATIWRERADTIHAWLMERAWDSTQNTFVEGLSSRRLDAVLLLLADLGFVAADDPRFVSTVETVGRVLGNGDGIYRYIEADDFGTPETSFTICMFWYIDALAAIGRMEEARAMFERVLARRNHLGLLSEDLAFEPHAESWGNFPQTYSHVGLIIAAMRLSRPWQAVI